MILSAIRGIKAKRMTNVFTFVILSLYIAGTSGVSRLHQFFHEHETVSHSAEQEEDPCHRALYHQDADHGCQHNTHVTASEKCDVCDLILHVEYIYPATTIYPATKISRSDFFYFIADFYSAEHFGFPARAPPFVA